LRKSGNNKEQARLILRRTALLPVGLIVIGFIYPGVTLLAKWSRPPGGWNPIQDCAAFPPEIPGIILLTFIIILGITPFFYRWLNSAIYAHTCNSIWSFAVGFWFLSSSFGVILCPPWRYAEIILTGFAIGFPFCTVVLFWVYFRPRLLKVVEINPLAYNFETMQYSMNTPLLRVDGKSSFAVNKLMMVGGLVGLALGKIVLDRVLGTRANDVIGVLVLLALSFFFIGLLAVNAIYLIWIIHKKSKEKGRKMTIKEFS